MDADQSRPVVRRPRKVARAPLPAGSVRNLREVLYQLYVEADCPRLDELAAAIAADDDLEGSPGKDAINRMIKSGGPASQQDTVTVAVALIHAAGRQDASIVARQVRQLWLAAQTATPAVPPTRLGRPVADCDPLALEVHPAIQADGERSDSLPAYVSRAHDIRLRQIVDQLLVDGSSRLVALVGGSSAGKTRACWELARYLDGAQTGYWRLWHPYDPTRQHAALADLDRVGRCTIVWLNEAQHYLMPADAGLGERIAAGLRTLLHDADRTPVLVLATLWPQYWDALMVRPDAGQLDPYTQARDLLTGSRVSVPDRFTPGELTELQGTGVDPRLRQAAAHSESGRITQYLAGAPELEDRYQTAPPAARAIIQVAIDARRLGHPVALPHALLAQATDGYLDSHDWDALGEDWLEQALAYTARPCKGARGPLTRIRPRPGELALDGGGQPCYRLADYLEQTGGIERAGIYPPDSLWRAFTTVVTYPDLLRSRVSRLRGGCGAGQSVVMQ